MIAKTEIACYQYKQHDWQFVIYKNTPALRKMQQKYRVHNLAARNDTIKFNKYSKIMNRCTKYPADVAQQGATQPPDAAENLNVSNDNNV